MRFDAIIPPNINNPECEPTTTASEHPVFVESPSPQGESVGEPAQENTMDLSINSLFVATVNTPAVDHFSVRENFKVTYQEDLRISEVGPRFAEHLLTKVEKNIPSQELRAHDTYANDRSRERQRVSSEQTFLDLADSATPYTNLASIFALLKQQGRGQDGILRIGGPANIFFVKDAKDTPWAIYCSYSRDTEVRAWRIEAFPIDKPAHSGLNRLFIP